MEIFEGRGIYPSGGGRNTRKRKMSVIVEFSTVPIGTGSTGLSQYVSAACRVVASSGLSYTHSPMGTIFEAGSVKEALEVIARAHEALFDMGARRVSTSIKIDDRRDKERCMEDKVRALRR